MQHFSTQSFGATSTKTKMCNLFVEGRCPHQHDAAKCKFAHGIHELRASEGYYKTSLCRFWLRGHCADGALCRHAHGREELRQRGTNYKQSELEKVARKHGVSLETLIEQRRTQRLKEDKGEVKVDQRTIQFNMQTVMNSAQQAATTAATHLSHIPTGCHSPAVHVSSSPSMESVSVDEVPMPLTRMDSGSTHAASVSSQSPALPLLTPGQQILALLVAKSSNVQPMSQQAPMPLMRTAVSCVAPMACAYKVPVVAAPQQPAVCVASTSPSSSSVSSCASSTSSLLSLADVRAGRCTIQQMLQSARGLVDWNPTELYED